MQIFVFCLDCDDVLLSHSLFGLLAELSQHCEVVYGDFLRMDEEGRYLPGADYKGVTFRNIKEFFLKTFHGGAYFQHSFMFSRRLFGKIGGYDESITFGEDFDLCVRFAMNGAIPKYVPIPTHLHRNHDQGLTSLYLDASVCPLRKAEWQAHFAKHRHALTNELTSEELLEIQSQLEIEATKLHLYVPPSFEDGLAISRRQKNTVASK